MEMIKFLLVDEITGVIDAVGTCSEPSLPLQGREGKAVLVMDVPEETSATHYWNGQDLTPYPPRPGSWAVWTGHEWNDPRPPVDPAQVLQEQRGRAYLTKPEFLLACMSVGMLTPAEAAEAALGIIPAPFQQAVDLLPAYEQSMILVVWPTATRIERLDPLILALAAGLGLSEHTLDAIFGLVEYEP